MNSSDTEEAVARYIQQDAFAAHLGIAIEVVGPGHGRAVLTVTEEMTNSHQTTHGSVLFALGDMAFAAASNSHGLLAVALNVSISFLKATRPGDRLIADATEIHLGGRTGLYEVVIRNAGTGEVVATSQNLAYRKNERIVPETEQNERNKA